MFEFNIEKKDDSLNLELKGALTIQNINEIKDVLYENYKTVNNLVISHFDASDFDLTYIQLLIALYKTSLKDGKKVLLGKERAPKFDAIVKQVGLTHIGFVGVENEQFIFSEEDNE